jgi:hypothetical protein
MKALALAYVALALAATDAAAHPIGRVCQYTATDSSGQQYLDTDYCHHLRVGTEAIPYAGPPGFRVQFGFGGFNRDRWRSGFYHGGGWRNHGGICIGHC